MSRPDPGRSSARKHSSILGPPLSAAPAAIQIFLPASAAPLKSTP